MNKTKNYCLIFSFITLFLLFSITSVFAAMTPAGTIIENQAEVTYEDANGNQKAAVYSNVVTITVKQVAGLELSPTTGSSNTPDDTDIYYDLTVTNTGNGTDSYTIAGSDLPVDWSSTIFKDENGNGVYDDGIDTVVSNTGNLVYGSSIDLVIMVSVPAGAEDQSSEALNVAVTSDYDNSVSSTATFTTTITEAVIHLNKTSSPSEPLPGDEVTYTVTITNEGTGQAKNLLLVDQIPTGVSYVSGSMELTDPAETITDLTDVDDADEGDYNITNPSAITLAIATLDGGKEYEFSFKVLVDSDLEAGSSIGNSVSLDYQDENGIDQAPETSNTSRIIISQQAGVEFTIATTSYDVTPGDQLVVPVEITNTGNGVDVFDGTYTSNYLSWVFYCDNDNNGLLDTNIDSLCVDTDGDGLPDTGQIQPGSTKQILGVTDVPVDLDDLGVDTLTFTAVSSHDTNVSTTASITTTVHTPVLTIEKTVTPTGEQPPGTVLTYTITVTNTGSGMAKNLHIIDVIPDHTTYVADSTYVNDIKRSDSDVLSGNTIEVYRAQLAPNGGIATVEFSVVID